MAEFEKYWSEKQHETWRATRSKGKWNFIIFKGILFFGVTMFIIMTFLFPLISKSSPSIGVNAVIFPLAGAYFGLTMWNSSEKKFLRHEK